jgi:hypothetical protein
MKNKTALLIFINGMLLFLFIFALSKIMSSPVSIFGSSEEIIEANALLKAIHINNILFAAGLLLSMILLSISTWKWNDQDFYNSQIMKRMRMVGSLFLIMGLITIILRNASGALSLQQLSEISYLNSSYIDGFLIGTIGLFFFLVSAVLLNAKRLKDENDLTI